MKNVLEANHFYNSFDYERLPGINEQEDHRTPFQIDRDRIIFSYAFRRLQSKTQVFQSGEYDFYRTRLTHSIEVSRIGRSICEYLLTQRHEQGGVLAKDFFIDPDLVEAIGLAHDLGHPPFGHIGERKIHKIMLPYGGFEGNAQTLRILTELIYKHNYGPLGMSPTRAFLDGILKYKALFTEGITASPLNGPEHYPRNHFIYDEQKIYRDFAFAGETIPPSLQTLDTLNQLRSIECQIMDWADDTAYSLHDILDGLTAGFLSQDKIEKWAAAVSLNTIQLQTLEQLLDAIKSHKVEARFSRQVGLFVHACRLRKVDHFMASKTNRYSYKLAIAEEMRQQCELYKKICFDLIFCSPTMQRVEFKGGFLLERLFEALHNNYLEPKKQSLTLLPQDTSKWVSQGATPRECARRLCDYVADLTDRLAIRIYKRLYDPEFSSIVDITS